MTAVMDAQSPRHPAQRVVFMKAAQVGATEAGTLVSWFSVRMMEVDETPTHPWT